MMEVQLNAEGVTLVTPQDQVDCVAVLVKRLFVMIGGIGRQNVDWSHSEAKDGRI